MTITVSQRPLGGGLSYIDSVTGLACSVDGVVLVDPVTGNPVGSLSVQGNAYSSQIGVTRTSDTNVYLAGDVIGTGTGSSGAVITFTNIGPAAGHTIITDVDLRVDIASVISGMTSFRLHLYNVTPPSALGDNSVWDLPSGDRASYLGYIDLGTPIDVGSTLFVQTSAVNKKVLMGSSTSLFGYMVTNGPYTPGSGDNFSIRLNAVGI